MRTLVEWAELRPSSEPAPSACRARTLRLTRQWPVSGITGDVRNPAASVSAVSCRIPVGGGIYGLLPLHWPPALFTTGPVANGTYMDVGMPAAKARGPAAVPHQLLSLIHISEPTR